MKPLRILLPIGVLAIAGGATSHMVRSKPKAKKAPAEKRGAIVEVVAARAENQRIDVRGYGTTVPAREVALSPEVGGRVTWLDPNLLPGSLVKQGTVLAKIDVRDYQLAVAQQLAAVDSAKTALEVEQGRKKIAEREWEVFTKKQGGEADPLALRDPQVRTARVAVKSAESGLRRAKLAASKTVIVAPFDAVVQAKRLEVGQMVAPGVPVINLVSTDAYYVKVSIPVSRLSWFDIPNVAGAQAGAAVDVVQQSGQQVVRRTGEVLRLLGEVDAAGRMAQLLVRIEDPLRLNKQAAQAGAEAPPPDSGLPLLIGTYVTVSIHGKSSEKVVPIARESLRDGDHVFVMTAQNTLKIKKVNVLWRHEEIVLIADGLEDGEKVIISPVPSAVAGMPLRVVGATGDAS